MTQDPSVRPLTAADLDRVVDIDRAITGRVRRGFYTKRFTAMAAEPKAFASLATVAGGRIVGFILAHILDGEFGGTAPVGVLDALGVDPSARGQGLAQKLMAALEGDLTSRGVRELRTEADWTEHDLVSFFADAGFTLAPRLTLERTTAEPANF